jgi:ethanolamine ammonia-lyase large subunit
MHYTASLGGKSYRFRDLRTLLARASPLRSADELAGLAAGSEEERAVAPQVLADVPLRRFLEEPLIDPRPTRSHASSSRAIPRKPSRPSPRRT